MHLISLPRHWDATGCWKETTIEYASTCLHLKRNQHLKSQFINYDIIGWDSGLAPNHYLDQCWLIRKWTLWDPLLWNKNQNTKKKIFQGNESLNGNCKMSPILFGPWYVAWCLGISWTIFHRSSNSMEIVLSVTKLQSVIQLTHFAHTTTGRLSCHVQNFVAITSLQLIWEN